MARQQVLNAHLEGRPLRTHCRPTDERADRVLAEGAARMGLSVRALTRVTRVARTIADLESGSRVEARHLAEALHFRLSDR
jgi:magnesium chelatase family protein